MAWFLDTWKAYSYLSPSNTSLELNVFDFEFPDETKMSFVSYSPLLYLVNEDVTLFIHDYLDSYKSWSRVLPLILNKRGILAVSLRGWGDSLAGAGVHSLEQYADDLSYFLKKLKVKGVTIVGHGMGSLVATQLAPKLRNKVNGLFLIGSPGVLNAQHVWDKKQGITFEDINDMLKEWQHRDDKFLSKFQLEDLQFQIDNCTMPSIFVEQIMEETLKADIRACKDIWNDMMQNDYTETLNSLRIPVIVLCGSNDRLFTKENQKQLLRKFSSAPMARFIVIDDAPHKTHWTNPSEVSYHINNFLINLELDL
mmetsp:Transcript_7620/g.9172  ORF Transcript_7620/g.9172 Transcript_7620/m.9172 type:complete len:310 (-) Transcript_7620:2167-3096(-)|eukprot:CAMPEP_0184033862 /NCGR_PEP_ID=MMETSP0955-20130417/4075_1 /TAXON_ID=627963 /ORGANISM="Aplanochytrium sp, Strain PBS07" /LENGTH=309 /DNA_ID=CAMNT_0026320379 /DNA_START=237 /DNA_END=1166 /DNA_ORIENTATION=+